MNINDAHILIQWIHNADYTPTKEEKLFMSYIMKQPHSLSPGDTARLEWVYRNSAGGGMYQEREGR